MLYGQLLISAHPSRFSRLRRVRKGYTNFGQWLCAGGDVCNDWLLLCIAGVLLGGWLIAIGFLLLICILVRGVFSAKATVKYISLILLFPLLLLVVSMFLIRNVRF